MYKAAWLLGGARFAIELTHYHLEHNDTLNTTNTSMRDSINQLFREYCVFKFHFPVSTVKYIYINK